MHRLEDLYHETDGKCYISFSGGKDSTVLLALAKMCAEIYTLPADGIKAVFINTGIEMGVTVDFVKWVKENYYANIDVIRPSVSFDWVLKNKGKPTLSKMRAELLGRYQSGKKTRSCIQNLIEGKTNQGKRASRSVLADKDMHFVHPDFPIRSSNQCCAYLKKKTATRYAEDHELKGMATGMRLAEGGARQMNMELRAERGGKICTAVSRDGFIKKSPVVDWSDEDVETFIEKYNVPLSKAYTEHGFTRTGCMACPFAKDIDHNLKYLHDFEPNRYKAIMHWLKYVYIAQNVILPFDPVYERERAEMWRDVYEPMRQEMLRIYRPNSKLIKDDEQLTLDF
jgi:3'-phosphoadenosine 5'-phosphosulfate sulfotransferase (PAPS reductase)/FAD synthetase